MVTAHLAGGPSAFVEAAEGAEDDAGAGAELVRRVCGDHDVVIGLAASGRTPFVGGALRAARDAGLPTALISANRSEEHTSELQSRGHLVCRLLLEKKKKNNHK